ncbi:MAG: family 43 glycosylhydrolase [Acidobacteriota bacterium]|nr:family 43 glycosylhydrolase [Acidobacteriota bacterium]
MFSTKKVSRYSQILLVVLLGAVGIFAQRGAIYTNPVQAGDYPDPSVIRVGRDYYATATSSEWGPEFPILHSRDLVNWNIVGVVFPKRPDWSVGNYWAPEIWQENGKFYIWYVARRKDGPLCIAVATAAKPTGPYTDHGALECQKVGSIDAFPIRDENGKLMVVWKEDGNSVGEPTPLWAQEFDEKQMRLVGNRREIMRNDPGTWEGHLIEGPFIMRHNNYFYMIYAANACCGRGCNYATGVARSKTLLGNWEKYDQNPILKGNENWNCPGHGSAVTTENGRTYFMYHAYHPKDTHYVGRQALLDEIQWTPDGWLKINNGNGPSKQGAAPHGIAEREDEYRFVDEFTSPTLRFGWQWLNNSIPTYRISNGFLELSPNENQERNPIGGIMAYYTTVGDYTATTMIDAASVRNGAIAGISAYGDGENALGFGLQNGKIVVWRRERNNHRVLSTHDAPRGNQLHLRLTARDGAFYSFAVSGDGRNFRSVGFEQNGDYLPPWDRGVRVALTVGGTENASARFGFLRIEPKAVRR